MCYLFMKVSEIAILRLVPKYENRNLKFGGMEGTCFPTNRNFSYPQKSKNDLLDNPNVKLYTLKKKLILKLI